MFLPLSTRLANSFVAGRADELILSAPLQQGGRVGLLEAVIVARPNRRRGAGNALLGHFFC
jgi:hypothetical protein